MLSAAPTPESGTPVRYVEAINAALRDLLARRPEVLLLGEDLADPYGGAFKASRGLSSEFPERVLSTPISEAALTGLAAGMAIQGLRPIVEIMFGDFLTLCTDQLVNGACKFSWMYNGQVRVPLVIRTPMGGRRGYGPTHSQSLENLFFSVPCLTILAPSRYVDPGLLLRRAVETTEQPLLFIEGKTLYGAALELPDAGGMIGDLFVTDPGQGPYPTLRLSPAPEARPDVCLVAYGVMASLACEAALRVFLERELVVEVVVPSRIKPMPVEDLLGPARRAGRVLVAEEGCPVGGFGAEVVCLLQDHSGGAGPLRTARVGARQTPIPSARHLEDLALPQVDDLAAAVKRLMEP